MKRINYIIFALLILIPCSVLASGSIKPSTSSLTITKGKTASFTIKASNAVEKVDISSSNTGIATVNTSSEWLENSSITVTVTGKSVGSTTIKVKLSDAAPFDDEELNTTYTISVNVKEPSSTSTPNSKTIDTKEIN